MLTDILSSIPTKHTGGAVELGKIKIGGKGAERQKQGGGTWRLPEKHDYFTITTMNRSAKGDLVVDDALMQDLLGNYGDKDGKLRQIPIRLLSDDIEDVLQSAFVWYGGKTIGARSDGVRVTWFNDPQNGRRYKEPIEDKWDTACLDMKDSKGKNIFKVHTNLSCVIAASESRWGGVYKFRTTSVISFRQLYGGLAHIHALTGGILAGMPLVLAVRPIQVSPEGTAITVHVVHVELRGKDLQQLQNQAADLAKFRLTFAKQIETTKQQYRKFLELPGVESPEDAKDIAEEFAPEEQTDEIPTQPEGQTFGLLDNDLPSAVDAEPLAVKESAPAEEAKFTETLELNDPSSPQEELLQFNLPKPGSMVTGKAFLEILGEYCQVRGVSAEDRNRRMVEATKEIPKKDPEKWSPPQRDAVLANFVGDGTK